MQALDSAMAPPDLEAAPPAAVVDSPRQRAPPAKSSGRARSSQPEKRGGRPRRRRPRGLRAIPAAHSGGGVAGCG
jgi:hypothetical protein